MIGRYARIYGRVQGVFFRGWTMDQAAQLGLHGWVRNRRDGSVELLAFGDEQAVEALIERCRRGPEAASVERIDVQVADAEAPDSFSKLPTA